MHDSPGGWWSVGSRAAGGAAAPLAAAAGELAPKLKAKAPPPVPALPQRETHTVNYV